jgi:hypothetical protein
MLPKLALLACSFLLCLIIHPLPDFHPERFLIEFGKLGFRFELRDGMLCSEPIFTLFLLNGIELIYRT